MPESKTVVASGAGLTRSHLIKRLTDNHRKAVVADDFSRETILNLTGFSVKVDCDQFWKR